MVGTDAHASGVIDNAVVLEDLFDNALRASVLAGSSDESESGSLKRSHSIVVTSGVGVLPDTVLEECLDDSELYLATDPTFITGFASFCPRLNDYYRAVHSQLAYYAVQNASFLFREPNGAINSYSGTVVLTAVSMPEIPAVITDAITISTATAERTITILADMLRGGAKAANG